MMLNRFFSKTAGMDFRREISWFAVYFLIFFFSIPVALMIGLENAREMAYHTGNIAVSGGQGILSEKQLNQEIARVLGINMVAVQMCVFAVCEAYHQFGYLHRKREVDFFHSLPHTRTQMYCSRIVNGIWNVLLPYTVCLLCGAGIAFMSGAEFSDLLGMVLPAWGINIFFYLLTYQLCILAVLLSGRALTGFGGMFVLALMFPALGLSINMFSALWLKSYVDMGKDSLVYRLVELSPVIQYAYFADWYNKIYLQFETVKPFSSLLPRLLANAAVLTGLFVSGILFYRKRQLECAGEAMAFRCTEPLFRILLSILGGMGSSAIFYSLRSEFVWAVFGMAAGVVISHCIIEMIYRTDFRMILKHKIQLAACILMGMLFLCMFHYDWLGYDRYLPEEADIASVQILLSKESYAQSYYGRDAQGECYYISPDKNNEQYMQLKDTEDIQAVLEMAAAGISALEQEEDRTGSDQELQRSSNLEITYHLKNGQQRKRKYYVSLDEITDAYGVVYSSDNYKRALYQILRMDPQEACEEIVYDEYGNSTELNLTEEQKKELLRAYQKDLWQLSLDDRRNAIIDASLVFTFACGEEEDDVWDTTTQRWMEFSLECPVYPDFIYTEELLKTYGVETGAGRKYLEQAEELRYESYNEEGEYVSGKITDPEELDLIRNNYEYAGYQDQNVFGPEIIPSFYLESADEARVMMDGVLIRNQETEAFVARKTEEADQEDIGE